MSVSHIRNEVKEFLLIAQANACRVDFKQLRSTLIEQLKDDPQVDDVSIVKTQVNEGLKYWCKKLNITKVKEDNLTTGKKDYFLIFDNVVEVAQVETVPKKEVTPSTPKKEVTPSTPKKVTPKKEVTMKTNTNISLSLLGASLELNFPTQQGISFDLKINDTEVSFAYPNIDPKQFETKKDDQIEDTQIDEDQVEDTQVVEDQIDEDQFEDTQVVEDTQVDEDQNDEDQNQIEDTQVEFKEIQTTIKNVTVTFLMDVKDNTVTLSDGLKTHSFSTQVDEKGLSDTEINIYNLLSKQTNKIPSCVLLNSVNLKKDTPMGCFGDFDDESAVCDKCNIKAYCKQ